MCAFTSSFTVSQLADGPLDVDNVMSVLAVKKLSLAARAKQCQAVCGRKAGGILKLAAT